MNCLLFLYNIFLLCIDFEIAPFLSLPLSFCSAITLSQSSALLCFSFRSFIPRFCLMRILQDCLDSRLLKAPRSIVAGTSGGVLARVYASFDPILCVSNCPFQSSLPSSNDVPTYLKIINIVSFSGSSLGWLVRTTRFAASKVCGPWKLPGEFSERV